MDRKAIQSLLESVRSKETSVDQALDALRDLPFEDLGFAKVDHHRSLRNGFPEVVFGQGKTTEQILAICGRIVSSGGLLLATRLSEHAGQALARRFPKGHYEKDSKTFHIAPSSLEDRGKGTILVVSAGTSDLPVATEAELTARLMGNKVQRLADVGVAGIHRLLDHKEAIRGAQVLVVVAGMEGALPSVVGGLVDKPVIAVPTSVGYGASFGGLAALLGMLNSCAPGVVVVNIDNGFGAGYAAALMNRRT